MFGTTLRKLVDDDLTSLRELETITGRGSSTIYRWMNGDSEPQYSDLHALVVQLKNPAARRCLFTTLTMELPIEVNWFSEEDPVFYGEQPVEGGQDVMEKTLMALDRLTEVLKLQHQAIRTKSITDEGFVILIKMIDDTVHSLNVSRFILAKYAPQVKKQAKR